MFDFQAHPGFLYVYATLLPLASFVLLLLVGGLRWAVRPREGESPSGLYELLGGGRPHPYAAYVATGAIAGAFVLVLIGFILFLPDQHHRHDYVTQLEKLEKHIEKAEGDRVELKKLRAERDAVAGKITAIDARWSDRLDWARIGPKPAKESDAPRGTLLQLGYRIDHLAAIMFLMVTFIATLIHIFSIGYMSEELGAVVPDHHVHTVDGHLHRRGRFGRFFMYLSLFCFSMLNLVLADNLFQVFLSWELVGICSYLLIGHYFERTSASNAANKAFITNRIGDAGFIIGLLIVWTYIGTFNFEDIFKQVRCPARHAHGDASLGGQIVRGEPVQPDGAAAKASQDLRVHMHDDTVKSTTQVILMPRDLGKHFHAPGHDATKEEMAEVTVRADAQAEEYGSMPYWMLVIAGLGIFLGCVGKSAQFPLQVWLPDAMEGPTPVSALIHAATMVAAGVYLVGRCFPLFTADVLLVIAYVGAITLFVAATIAIVMTDIKKVLAYSTVSQLGYMMLALGIGGWVAGLFHLLTHAFFKALLFLGSGSVIYGCHHEQEMTKMGGLYPKMKITALTMLVGVLAIAGIPGFSGWYSKDAILAQAIGYTIVHPQHILLFVLPLLTAGITTFYMFRMWLMTFTGKPRDEHVYEHAHESPRLMTTPLIILAAFSVFVAWGWPFFSSHFPFIDPHGSLLEHQLHHSQPVSVQADFGALLNLGETGPAKDLKESERRYAHEWGHTAGNIALGVVVLAMAFAFAVYYFRVLDPEEAKEQFPAVHAFLTHKWYFDELYSAILVRPALAVAGWFKWFDTKVIDGTVDGTARGTVRFAFGNGRFDLGIIDGLANLIATVCQAVGGWLRTVQTGYIRSYILFLALAALGIFMVLTYFVARVAAG